MTATVFTQHEPFLREVMEQGQLADLFEARDMTEVVYRTMRDLMDKDAIERVQSELSNKEAVATDDKTLQTTVGELWKDTNPLVAWLSRLRPAFDKDGPFGIDDEKFLARIEREGGMPATTNAATVTKAVFAATKKELSPERIQEIAACLPGKIQTLWTEA